MKEERILAYKKKNYKVKKTSLWKRLFLAAACLLYTGVLSDFTWRDFPSFSSEETVKLQQLAQNIFEQKNLNLPEELLSLLKPSAEPANVPAVTLAEIPEYTGDAYVTVNQNVPQFSEEELRDYDCNSFAELDSLGRCGVTQVMLGPETMPMEERGEIGMVKPTGWHTVKYQGADGHYLYNRCHLIGYQLSGENANEKNLITGTRYLNVTGMLPFENQVAEYIRRTAHHVLYRVTPIFDGSNLLASGVLMEAQSIEDAELSFSLYCYNVQPGITIDYASGDSSGPIYG